MGTKIGKEKILREKGYLYFIGKDGYCLLYTSDAADE